MDKVTEVFYQLLKKAENNQLSWEPSLLSLSNWIMGCTSQINMLMDEEPENPAALIKKGVSLTHRSSLPRMYSIFRPMIVRWLRYPLNPSTLNQSNFLSLILKQEPRRLLTE